MSALNALRQAAQKVVDERYKPGGEWDGLSDAIFDLAAVLDQRPIHSKRKEDQRSDKVMNEQTPETNHVEAQLTNMSHPFVWQLCRKLERERDEARELADRLAKIVDEGLEGTDEGLEGMNEDGHLFITEARKALAAWKEARND